MCANEAGVIEPVKVEWKSPRFKTIRDLREAVWDYTQEIMEWSANSLDGLSNETELFTFKEGIGSILETCKNIRDLVDNSAMNNKGAVIDTELMANIYGFALLCFHAGKYHQLFELSDVLTKEQVLRQILAGQADAQSTLDTIQTHTAGVPAMVEREKVDSAREQFRVMAQMQLMELTQPEMRLLQLWHDHESMAAIARTMNISRRTAYNIKYAIEAKYAANTQKHHPLPSPFVKLPSVREDEEQRIEDMTGQQVKRNQRRK